LKIPIIYLQLVIFVKRLDVSPDVQVPLRVAFVLVHRAINSMSVSNDLA